AATSSRSTHPITGARTCPTSPSAPRCFAARRSSSGWLRAGIFPTSAVSRRARCRRTPSPSARKASTSTISSWWIAAVSAKRSWRRLFAAAPPPRAAVWRALLAGAASPPRNPAQNIADLRAQIAANEKGAQELHKMVAQFGLPAVQAYMGHVQDNAAESVRRVIDKLHDSSFVYEMDQGTRIQVKISVDKRKREA